MDCITDHVRVLGVSQLRRIGIFILDDGLVVYRVGEEASSLDNG